MNTPAEILQIWIGNGVKKANLPVFKMILLGMAAASISGSEPTYSNMTYIPLGMFLGAEVSVGQLLIGNLLPVTIGNLIGGAVIVPVWYYFSFKQWDTHQTVDTPCGRIE